MPRTTRRIIAPIQTTLANACRKPPDDRSAFEGSLGEIGVVALLEMLERSQRSGRLVLRHGPTWVAIDWIQGRIAAARAVGADGPYRALEVALAWQDGTFELLPVAFDGQRAAYTVAELLLESAYEADQATRHQGAQFVRR